MMTFRQIQDQAIRRFKSSLRTDLKEWIRTFYGLVWDLEDWTFKSATATVTVTSGLQTVSGLPADLGVPHQLQNQFGQWLEFMEPHEFERFFYDATAANIGAPYAWTSYGDGPARTVKVGPTCDETRSDYQLVYERACGYYPSTTANETTTLPDATLTVTDTSAFPSSGSAMVNGRKIDYTGKGATTLTGCTGGTGAVAVGDLVVSLAAVAGQLAADSDVPLLPFDGHMVLVHGAQSIGRSLESDVTLSLQDDQVQRILEGWRRRYLVSVRGEGGQFGSVYDDYDIWG